LHLYLVDPWRDTGYQVCKTGPLTDATAENFLQTALRRLKPFESRYAILRMLSQQATLWVPDASQTLVFIDANHLFEYAQADLGYWEPKVIPGGIICGHDYGHGGDTGDFGVTKAVNERYGEAVNTSPDHMWWVRLP
jgi:hypothetical protein